MKKQTKDQRINKKDGVTYVIETIKDSNSKPVSIIKSRWIPKPIYAALLESNLYNSFMAATTLKECTDILAHKTSSFRRKL